VHLVGFHYIKICHDARSSECLIVLSSVGIATFSYKFYMWSVKTNVIIRKIEKVSKEYVLLRTWRLPLTL
jgi:hypothetical protein